MKRPLYYLLCAIACTSMVSSTMPMAAIAEAIQPQAAAEQQAQADAASNDTGKAKDGTGTNATADSAESSAATSTDTGAANASSAASTESADATSGTTTADATSGTTTADATSGITTATTAPTPSLRTQAAGTPEAITTAAATAYAHSATATLNGVTFTVSWDDAPAGSATTFHVTQTGGSSQAKARMDVPTYWDGGSPESVCDPSRQAWSSYHDLGTVGHDFTFDFTASGTYRIHFYFMDNDRNDSQNDKGIYYLRTTAEVTVNDAARPSVTQIVNNAGAQCRQETNGSEYDMALWLHDWTLDQLEYDHSLNWCSAESGLTRHRGTCESYQRIYSKLLDAAGIANGRITGNGHTWNAAKIDGKWCQMDLTWDDTSDNWYGDLDQRHLYFGLTDELMAIAHSDHTANYQKDGYAYRSTDLSNNYFVQNGKADEWAEKYSNRIQQHLDAKEESFSIDADNQSFPPSISGIQNGIVAYAMNRREWSMVEGSVTLTGTSNVTAVSSYQWSAMFDFKVEYPPSSPTSSIRLGGNTRYDTMVAIADAGFTSSDTVVLASGENFPDALSASSLAGAYKAPVIMTSRDSLSEQAKTEIERLGASKVFIIGSPAAISTSVESMLGDMGLTTERIAGSNRQETAAKVASKTADAKSPSTVIVASGENFPDALSISPYAYAKGYPIYLTEDRGALSLSTIKAIQSLGTVERVIIVGSSAVVSESSESQLESIAPTVERWSGSNRYETSLRIAEGAVADGMTWSNVVVASGENFPDGLAGASLAGKRGGVLLLTAQGDASAVAHAIASAKGKVKSCYVLGSEAAVSANAKKQIDSTFS